MEERPAETNASVDSSMPPSVAQLAGRFREQAAAAKAKSPPSVSHPPKIKVKNSPLIEKLQANLAFDPVALLPGASPKSPGIKTVVSPFHSPPSTPGSPGVPLKSSEPEEVPVSFDQPPEDSHLPCYNKVRTRGSIKRRPPSRRFRKSQSDCGDFRAAESSQENGAKEENGDEVFTSNSKAPGPPPSGAGAVGKEVRRSLGLDEKHSLRRTSSRTEKAEEKGRSAEKAKQEHLEEQVGQSLAQKEAIEPPQTSSSKAENRCRSPMEETTAGEEAEMEKSTEIKEERAGNEENKPEQKSQDTKKQEEEERVVGEEASGKMEGSNTSEQEVEEEKREERHSPKRLPEPGFAQSETNSEVPREGAVPTLEDDAPFQDTKM